MQLVFQDKYKQRQSFQFSDKTTHTRFGFQAVYVREMLLSKSHLIIEALVLAMVLDPMTKTRVLCTSPYVSRRGDNFVLSTLLLL